MVLFILQRVNKSKPPAPLPSKVIFHPDIQDNRWTNGHRELHKNCTANVGGAEVSIAAPYQDEVSGVWGSVRRATLLPLTQVSCQSVEVLV